MSKNVVISGATGFIGSKLARYLVDKDYNIVVLTRDISRARAKFERRMIIEYFDGKTCLNGIRHFENAEAIINLAGENIGTGFWTRRKKAEILQSRLSAIRAFDEVIKQTKNKPKCFIQSSATGYYGSQGNKIIEENSAKGDGFLASVCETIEDEIKGISEFGIRTAIIRSGIVLGNGGYLKKIQKIFKKIAGVYFGNPNNWISWIHIEDEIRAIEHIIKNENLNGIFNLTAPSPVIAKTFNKELCRKFKCRTVFNLPAFLALLTGKDFANDILLTSQRVLPTKLESSGFEFLYKEIGEALDNLIQD